MTSRDDYPLKIKRLRELHRLLVTYRKATGHRPSNEDKDLVRRIEVQVAWMEHRLSTDGTGEYSHA